MEEAQISNDTNNNNGKLTHSFHDEVNIETNETEIPSPDTAVAPTPTGVSENKVRQPEQNGNRYQVYYLTQAGHFVIKTLQSNGNVIAQLTRRYEDFKLLNDKLTEDYATVPILLPPIPENYVPEVKDIPANQASCASKSNIVGLSNASEFAHYLNALKAHEKLANNRTVCDFLSSSTNFAPELTTHKSGFFSDWIGSSKGDNKKHFMHRDIDEYYDGQRNRAMDADAKLGNFCADFEAVLVSHRKISSVFAHLSTCLRSTFVINEPNTELVKFNKCLTATLDDYMLQLETESSVAFLTLGVMSQYLLAYNNAFKQLLLKRIEVLMEYENVNRALAKAFNTKNHEKAMADKKEVEAKFEKFSEEARDEIKHYDSYKSELFIGAINGYVQNQVKLTKSAAGMIRNCLDSLKDL